MAVLYMLIVTIIALFVIIVVSFYYGYSKAIKQIGIHNSYESSSINKKSESYTEYQSGQLYELNKIDGYLKSLYKRKIGFVPDFYKEHRKFLGKE